jgi:hypothetical protein
VGLGATALILKGFIYNTRTSFEELIVNEE